MKKKSPLRLAVASKDAISINLHFGHATSFLIYRVDDEDCDFISRREVEHYCHGYTGNQSAMEKILRTIDDCHAVFVAKIGNGPTEKLRSIGVEAVSEYAYEGIEASLFDFVQKIQITNHA